MKNIFSLLSLCLACLTAAVNAEEIMLKNSGYGGDTTIQGLNRVFTDVIDYSPDCVIMAFGMNDVSLGRVAIDQYRKNYLELIKKLRANGVKHIVVMTTNPVIEEVVKARIKPEKWRKEGTNFHIRKYNEIVQKIAKDEKLELFDLHQFILDNGGHEATKQSFIRNPANNGDNDGVHLNPRGYQAIAKQLAPIIKKLGAKRIVCFGDSITYGANLPGGGTLTGSNYPSYLWKELNPDLVTFGSTPKELRAASAPTGKNMIRNSSFESCDDQKFPLAWVLWKKNQDKAEVISDGTAANGKNHIRLTGSKKSLLQFRTAIYPVTPGKYIIRGKVRGKDKVSVELAVYEKVNPKMRPLTDIQPSEKWHSFEIPFETDSKVKKIFAAFRTNGIVELDDITIEPFPLEKKAFPGKTETLKNNEMTIKIASPESGGAVISVVNNQGTEFVQFPNGGIWEIRFRAINFAPRGPDIPLAFDPEQNDGILDNEEKELIIRSEDLKQPKVKAFNKDGILTYQWTGIDVGEEKNALDVTVRYRLNDKGFCLIDGSFENRSKIHTVFYYVLPRLSGIGGINGEFEKDYLAVPSNNGRLINNPIEKGLFNKKTSLVSSNSAGHSLQMDLYYNDGNGFYFGTFDPLMYVKRYQVTADETNRIGFSVMNVPDNMKKVPQKWNIPYPAGFKTFKGDWFDGCMIYRDWALKQPWCSQGPLISRKSVPKWFKETDILTNIPIHRMRDSLKNTERMLNDLSKFNVTSKTFYWGLDNVHFDTLTPDRLPLSELDQKYMKFTGDRKIKTIAYLQATAWSERSKSYNADLKKTQDNLVRNYYGQALYWILRKGKFGKHYIGFPGEYWTNILADVVEGMAKAGFCGAYMDSGNHAGSYMQFTAANPKESGGGLGYLHGMQKMLNTLRARAQKIDPEFVFTSESFWEGNIAHLDAFWVINNNSKYLEHDRVILIPMVQAVYHDYTIMFGLWESRWDIDYDRALSWATKTGLYLAWGVKPGGVTPNLFYTADHGDLGLEIVRKNLEVYSKARKFLTYGTMLRPPKVENCKKVNIRWCRGYSKRFQPLTLDCIVTTAWRSPEGDSALFFYNLTEEPQELSAVFDKKDYGFKTFSGICNPVSPEGFAPKISIDGDQVSVKGTLPPRTPVIFEIK